MKQPIWPQDAVILNEPGRRAGTRGGGGDPLPRVHALAGYGIGEALSIIALVAGKVLARQNHRRARMSTVSFAGPSCHLSRTKRIQIWRARGRGGLFGTKIVSGVAREADEVRAGSP